MPNPDPFLFYEDEDKLLPLLLHSVEPQAKACECIDCLGIRVRLAQIERHQEALRSAAA